MNAALIACVMSAVPIVTRAQEPRSTGPGNESKHAILEYETAPTPFVSGSLEVWDAAVSPNSRLLATSGADGKIRLYDRESRALLRLAVCHEDSIPSVEFSPDGTLLATASYDQSVKIWQLPTLQLLQTLTGHTGRVVCATFAPDGARLASTGYDGTVRIWDVAAGKAVNTFDGDGTTIRCAAFAPDGVTIVSGDDDGLVKIWDPKTMELFAELEGHEGRVRAVAFAPRGENFASAGEDGKTRIWDPRTRTLAKEVHTGVQAWRLAFSSNGSMLATGFQDGSIRLVEVATGRVVSSHASHSDIVSSLDFLVNDRTYYSSSYDGSVFAWNARMPAQPTVARRPTDQKVWSTAVAPGGHLIALGGRGGYVQIIDLRTGERVRQFEAHSATADCLEFSSNGSQLAAASWRSPDVLVWQANDATKKHQFVADSEVRAVAFSPDGRHLAAACTGGQLVVWDLADGKRAADVSAHQMPVYDVAYAPNGRTLVTCCGDWTKPEAGNVKLWKADSVTEIAKLEGHETAVRSVVFRSDGKHVASASERGVVKIWDVATNMELASLGNSAGARAIVYASDGKLLAVALHDGTINLWDLEKVAIVRRLRGEDDMFSIQFSLDDSVIFGVGGQRRVLFWDLSSLRPAQTATWLQAWPGKDNQE